MGDHPIALHLVNFAAQNQIIPAYWYNAKHNIKSLYIRDENIRDIQSNAFNTDAFKRLIYLEFDGLKAIKHISAGLFNGLFSLKVFIIRNANLFNFQSSLFIPNQNPAQNTLSRHFYRHQSVGKVFPKWNQSSTYFETFYLAESYTPSKPWIVLKNIPVIITTALLSSLFSFSLSLKVSFVLLQLSRKINRKAKEFMQNVENEAAAMFVVENDISNYRARVPMRKIQKLRFSDLHFLLKRRQLNGQLWWVSIQYNAIMNNR